MTIPKVDAKNRAMRTLVQGFAIDVLIAVAGTAYVILTGSEFGWMMLLTAMGKTAATTAASYVMRLKLGTTMLRDTTTPTGPVVVQIGDYTLELQRPGVADHSQEAVLARG